MTAKEACYYIHKKNGRRYAMLQECKMRIGDYWVAGYVYVRNGKMFCRVKSDFENSFVEETIL